MIDYTYLKSVFKDYTSASKAALTDQAKAALTSEMKQLLSHLKIGDTLQGQLLRQNGENGILKLLSGQEIPVKLLENMPLNKLLELLVLKNEGARLELQLVPEAKVQQLSDKVITTLSLPESGNMKACIESFVNQELPLSREEILKVYHLGQKLKLPYPVLTQLLDKMGGVAADFSQLSRVDGKSQLLELAQSFKGTVLNHPELSEENKQTNALKLLEVCLRGQSAEKVETLYQGFKQEHKEGLALKDSIVLESQPQIPLEAIQRQDKSLVNGQEVKQPITMQDMPKEWLKSLVEQPEQLVKFASKVYDKLFEFSFEESTKQGSALKESVLFKAYNQLIELIETQEALQLTKPMQREIQELREPLATWGKLNELGNYFLYPIELKQHKGELEVYFFKPKKQSKGNKKNFYAVIALDMPHIQHIDIHIHQVEQSINLTLDVADEWICDFFGGQMEKLMSVLADKGYQVGQYNCQVKKDKSIGQRHTQKTQTIEGLDFKI